MEKLSLVQRPLYRLARRLPPAARLLFCRQLFTPLVRWLHWLLAACWAGQLLWFALYLAHALLSWQSMNRQGMESPLPAILCRPGTVWLHSGAAGWALVLLLPLGLALWGIWDQHYPIRSADTLRRLPCRRAELWLGMLLLPALWMAAAVVAQLTALLACRALWEWLVPAEYTGFF